MPWSYYGGPLAIGSTPFGTWSVFYTGAHSHMDKFGGSVVAPRYGVSVTTGAPIYKFTWDDGIIYPEISETEILDS